ncbi:interleukin-17 receptor D [Cololabis saira]|uniref:interleukin-17 receptor D n=1 Tax=Cololabis saira TaxID=129043 RepID=UPI002AD5270A|nr:interleukin-17 receptor D [Cololabis saira]
MWRTALVLYWLWALALPLRARTDTAAAVVSAQDCSLECIRQGGAACEYCRITKDDIKKVVGFNAIGAFGSCVPWPCFALLGGEDPEICQHYVQAPSDVNVDLVDEPNPKYDTIVVSWRPSYYGISFLRGFQVSLQALGGSGTACQLFFFHRNVSLSASQAQTVYMSDPFPGLSLGSQYAVTVIALPVPEEWEKFYRSKIFSTRSCAEKNGLEHCKQDWYPEHVEVQQDGSAIEVTFNLAPPNLGIKSYFSLCYANGKKRYTDITPNSSENKTHHTYQLYGLQEETNYTCEIAANEVDAVRKTFSVQVKGAQKENASVTTSLALVLPLCLSALVVLGVALAVLTCRRPKLPRDDYEIKTDIIWHRDESQSQEEAVSLPGRRLTPPRLLICYSSHDGPHHVKAVLQFAAFVQQHMATQVLLDLWDSLGVAEEGSMAWYCRQIRESDFVLVISSPGLQQRPEAQEAESNNEEEEPAFCSNAYSSQVAVQVIGEEVGRAKAQGRDLSKYMAAIFEYSDETDIPTELRLVSRYTLTRDLALFFSHLHGVALHRPGGYLKIERISDQDFAASPAGSALQRAIRDAGVTTRAKMQRAIKEVD